MFIIAEINGHQYKFAKGDMIDVEKFKNNAEGDTVKIDTILLKSDGSDLTVGTPYIKGASAELKIVKHAKGEKLIVYKKKPKKRYERKIGHRQQFTRVEVVGI
jgi:large subunit ribosomal protein L21